MGDTGEVAKAASPLIENLAKLTGPMCEEMGLYFGDKVRAFRQKNITTVIEGSIRRLADAGKPVRAVPPRLLIPIFDAASIEDNPTLQDMWSGLLASASDQADAMSPSFVETLKALTPTEARSITFLYDKTIESTRRSLGNTLSIYNELISVLASTITAPFSPELAAGISKRYSPILILDTFERQGLIRRDYDLKPAKTTFGAPAVDLSQKRDGPLGIISGMRRPEADPPVLSYDLSFTPYGIEFMSACQGPVSAVNDKSK